MSGWPTRTFIIEGESVELPDWDRIQWQDILTLKLLGDKIGYGRCIQVLQEAWSKKCQEDVKFPMDRKTADLSAGIICVWCDTDRRTGKKAT